MSTPIVIGVPDRLRDDPLGLPRADRLDRERPDYEVIVGRHAQACRVGLSMYRDPRTGAMVMTARYLLERAYCCKAGCRHCPYE